MEICRIGHYTVHTDCHIAEEAVLPVSSYCRSDVFTRYVDSLSHRESAESYQEIIIVILHTAHGDATDVTSLWSSTVVYIGIDHTLYLCVADS